MPDSSAIRTADALAAELPILHRLLLDHLLLSIDVRHTVRMLRRRAPRAPGRDEVHGAFRGLEAKLRGFRRVAIIAVGVACATLSAGAAEYPLTLTANAKVSSGATTVTSIVTIQIDRLMEPSRRAKVLDGLKFNGYQGFMNALRVLPAIGVIKAGERQVDVRYAWESTVDKARRLIIVADKPLVFLGGEASKPRAGYELTVVDLRLDDRGAVSGTMTGAARVKPAPDDGVVLDDYAVAPIELTFSGGRP